MVLASDYYSVLGVSRSADAAEIKRAYREQALRHHPDKNLHQLKDATERFKLVGEAFSVLSDPKQRAAYDGADYAKDQKTDSGGNEDSFNIDQARELFRDTVGRDFSWLVARAAECTAPHVTLASQAARSQLHKLGEHVSKSKLVRSAVSSHLSSMADGAASDFSAREEEVNLREADRNLCLRKLAHHRAMCEVVWNARQERKISWKEAMRRKAGFWQTRQQAADLAFDSAALATREQLQREVQAATLAWCQAIEDAGDAEHAAFHAEQTKAIARQDGVSLDQATEAGKHLFRGLFGYTQ